MCRDPVGENIMGPTIVFMRAFLDLLSTLAENGQQLFPTPRAAIRTQTCYITSLENNLS